MVVILGIGFSPRQTIEAQPPMFTGNVNSCITPLYDPKFKNRLVHLNHCPTTIQVLFYSRDGKDYGAYELPPGIRGDTVLTEREVNAMGGLEIYACPQHYHPVKLDNTTVNKPVKEFKCKYGDL